MTNPNVQPTPQKKTLEMRRNQKLHNTKNTQPKHKPKITATFIQPNSQNKKKIIPKINTQPTTPKTNPTPQPNRTPKWENAQKEEPPTNPKAKTEKLKNWQLKDNTTTPSKIRRNLDSPSD
jgi:hypothetical protein